MNEKMNTTATMTAEQQVMNILKVSDFAKFLKETSDNFQVEIDYLLPSDFDITTIHNIENIESYFVEVVMSNLFESFKERNFTTEYIAYTYQSVETAKVFFMGKEIKNLLELIDEDKNLEAFATSNHFLSDDLREEFYKYITLHPSHDSKDFIAFRFKELEDAVCRMGVSDCEIGGSYTYYLSIDSFSTFDNSNSHYVYFMNTHFKEKELVVIDTDTENITEEMFDTLEDTYCYNNWYRITHPKSVYEKCDLEDDIFEIYPKETLDTDSVYRRIFIKENLDKMYADYENGKFDPSDYDAKVAYIKQVFETWSLAKGYTKKVLVMQ